MNASRCLNLILCTLLCASVGCGEMTAMKMDAGGQGPLGPGNVPGDPSDLDSGIQTPFSRLNPDKEIWVATSYGNDSNPGTLFEPKKTIGAALAIAKPGNAIMVKAGIYREYLKFPTPGGQTGLPIWLRSADGKGKAEIAARSVAEDPIHLIAVNAIIIEGFKINGSILISSDISGKTSTNILVQNNNIVNGRMDGITVEYGQSIYLIRNDISAAPRGQGIQLVQSRNVTIVDNYIHDLRTSGTKNDGINIKADSRDVLIQNNIIDRIDGTAVSLEGFNITARANSLQGFRRAAAFTGCSNCTLDKNEILASSGLLTEVALTIGDSPIYPTANIKLTNNCIPRAAWLYVEPGTSAGLVNQSNTADACH